MFQPGKVYKKRHENVKKKGVWKWVSVKGAVVGLWVPTSSLRGESGSVLFHSKPSKVSFKRILRIILKWVSCIWGLMPDLHLGKLKSTLGWGLTPSQELWKVKQAVYLEVEPKECPELRWVFNPRVYGAQVCKNVHNGPQPKRGCLGHRSIELSGKVRPGQKETWDETRGVGKRKQDTR